jgi:hypothetical protein
MDATFRNHNLLQTVALHQEFFIPFPSAEIILFLNIDNCSVDTRDSLSGIWVNRDNPVPVTAAHFDDYFW